MNAEDFLAWMVADGMSEHTAGSRVSNCQTVERCQRVDLDEQYTIDRCNQLISLFNYTTVDERMGRPPRHHVVIDGNIRNGSATYKTAIRKYVAFKDHENEDVQMVHAQRRHAHRGQRRLLANEATPNRESYGEFFDEFGIDTEAICGFGLEHSVFADPEIAFAQWERLKGSLLNGHELRIRAISGNDNDREFQFYKRLNAYLFNNEALGRDCTGNYYPRRNLEKAVGWRVTIRPDRDMGILVNFQTSHVLSGRTHNPLLYSAVWNIVFTPKIIDPFTGDEAQGEVAEHFRNVFLQRVRARFINCIEDYNRFVRENQILERIQQFEDEYFGDEELRRFKAAALNQWALV